MQGVVVWCGCRRRPPPATLTHGSTALLNVAVCQTKLQRACAGHTAGVAAPLPGLLAHKGSAGLRRCSVEGAKGGSSRYLANRLAQTAVAALCHPAVFHFECCHGPKIEQWREVQVKVVCVCATMHKGWSLRHPSSTCLSSWGGMPSSQRPQPAGQRDRGWWRHHTFPRLTSPPPR